MCPRLDRKVFFNFKMSMFGVAYRQGGVHLCFHCKRNGGFDITVKSIKEG